MAAARHAFEPKMISVQEGMHGEPFRDEVLGAVGARKPPRRCNVGLDGERVRSSGPSVAHLSGYDSLKARGTTHGMQSRSCALAS